MKNFVQNGEVLTYMVPSSTTIASGDAVLVGDMLGVAQTGGTTGDKITLALEGVFTLPKTANQAYAQGVTLYWDNSAKKITSTASGNKQVGWAWDAAANSDATCTVKLMFS